MYVEPKKRILLSRWSKEVKVHYNVPFKWKVNIFEIIPKYGGGQKS